MATRLKTVEFAHPLLASMSDNTLTSLTQISVYLPEAPSGAAFKSVIAVASAHEFNTTTGVGNVTTRQVQCRLGAAGYTAHTNSNLHTGSGENISDVIAVDLTSHFQTNWTGTSMTFDSQVLFDGTAASLGGWYNVVVTLYVTYEYDDTVTTQIKTVRIPLDMPVGDAPTSKPGSATATVPNLSTELPEASKVYRSTHIIMQGNRNAASTTDATVNLQLDSTAAFASNPLEGAANTDYFYRVLWDCSAVLDTNASMGFYFWSNLARLNHSQAWLVVTYEFDASASNDMFVSLLLPMEVPSPMGGPTSSDYQRGTREVWIEEPGTITTKQIAFYSFWDQIAAIGGLNMRLGAGGFVTYTDRAAAVAGSNAAMTRNDAAFTLDRGRNTLNWDVYRTDTVDVGYNVSGFWIVNYTAGKPADGHGAANHTVFWNLGTVFGGAAASLRYLSAVAPAIPESTRFYSAVGTRYLYITNSTGSAAGVSVLAERLSAEGGVQWESAYTDIGRTDAETGLRCCFSQVRTLFNRWADDPQNVAAGHGGERMDLQTARRWLAILAQGAASFDYLDLIFTYHTITFGIAGNISGSNGGTVTIEARRVSNGEVVAETSRSGDGAFSMTWYDDTEEVYVDAYEDATHLGRSAPALAA